MDIIITFKKILTLQKLYCQQKNGLNNLKRNNIMIDYIDVENYSAIKGELSFRDIDVKSIINIETKKKYFRIWFRTI
jgi:hypothetical protein